LNIFYHVLIRERECHLQEGYFQWREKINSMESSPEVR
jgi:hypothetical protein